MTPTQEARLAEALHHVEMGFWVFPTWSTTPDGTCKCPKGANCDQKPGKHPYTDIRRGWEHGFRDATNDPERIRTFMSVVTEPNYGVVWPEGPDVVFSWDLDGPEWREKLADLATAHGPLPLTKTTTTPHGGRHAYYRWPEAIERPGSKSLFGFITRWPWDGYVNGPLSSVNGTSYTSNGVDRIATFPETWAQAALDAKPARKFMVVGDEQGFELPATVPGDEYAARHDAIRDFVAHLWNRHNSFEVTDLAVRNILAPRFTEPMEEPRFTHEIAHAWDTAKEKWVEPAGAISAPKAKEARQKASDAKEPFVYEPFMAYKHRMVQWAWDRWLPRGVVTLLDGNPGVGKSNIVIDLVARASKRRAWPDGAEAGPRTLRSLVITREDDPSTTLGPRLAAAGGDPNLVFFLEGEMVLPDDAGRLRNAIMDGKFDIVVIDPIFSHISADVKTISDNDARVNVMNPLAEIADEAGCAMLILRHFNKNTASSALNRGAGSLGGFVGAARQVLAVTTDPDSDDDNPMKVFGVVKSNYGPTNVAMKYSIEGFMLPGWTQSVSRIRWEGVSRLSVDDILSNPDTSRSRGAADDLTDVFASGGWKMKPADALAKMKARGYGKAATYTAAKRIGIEMKREGFPSSTVWTLVPEGRPHGTPPVDDDPDAEPLSCLLPDEHTQEMSPVGIQACRVCQPSFWEED